MIRINAEFESPFIQLSNDAVVAFNFGIIECLQPHEPANAFASPAELVLRVGCKKCVQVDIVKADSVVRDSKSVDLSVHFDAG